jgi:hypothetical protein
MKTRLVVLSCYIALAAVLAHAQGADDGFQMARVMSIEKLAQNAQHMSDEINYKILMRLGDTIYECRTSAQAATFIDWSPGKQFPVRIEGKTLLAKNFDGQIVQMNIKKTSH